MLLDCTIIMNLLSFSVTSIFHVIIVEKQFIKHDTSTHCLTCNFRHMSIFLSISIYCHTPSRTFLAGVCCRARLAEKKKIKAK